MCDFVCMVSLILFLWFYEASLEKKVHIYQPPAGFFGGCFFSHLRKGHGSEGHSFFLFRIFAQMCGKLGGLNALNGGGGGRFVSHYLFHWELCGSVGLGDLWGGEKCVGMLFLKLFTVYRPSK